MAEFKVGDKVRVVSGRGYGSKWVDNTSTVISVGTRYVNIQQPGRCLIGEFYAENLVHVAEPVAVGDTVKVTYTGKVLSTSTNFIEVEGPGRASTLLLDTMNTWGDRTIEVIEKAKPVYEPGKLYVDAEGCTVFYNAAGSWLHLRTDGFTELYVPAQPVTEAKLQA